MNMNRFGIGLLSIAALSAVVLSACGSTGTAQTLKPSEPLPTTTKTEPAGQTTPPTNTEANKPPKHRTNPRRLFQQDELEQVKIKIGKNEFNCWVMDTNEKRMEGMMFLEAQDFTEKDSMIFVFPEADERSFWMQNTLVDLDIAYVSPKHTIISIHTMIAHDETGVPSNGKAMYAIEFKARLLKKLGIKPGMKVEIPEKVVAKD